jgi:hypothetical protein
MGARPRHTAAAERDYRPLPFFKLEVENMNERYSGGKKTSRRDSKGIICLDGN